MGYDLNDGRLGRHRETAETDRVVGQQSERVSLQRVLDVRVASS